MNRGDLLGAFTGTMIELVELPTITVVVAGLASGGLVVLAVLRRGARQRVPVRPTEFFAAAPLVGLGEYRPDEGLGGTERVV